MNKNLDLVFTVLTIEPFHSLYGTLLFIQCRSAKALDLSFLFLIAMLLDVVETSIFNFATKQYPEHVSSGVVRMASIANELKWVACGSGMVSLVALFVYNSLGKRVKSHKQ